MEGIGASHLVASGGLTRIVAELGALIDGLLSTEFGGGSNRTYAGLFSNRSLAPPPSDGAPAATAGAGAAGATAAGAVGRDGDAVGFTLKHLAKLLGRVMDAPGAPARFVADGLLEQSLLAMAALGSLVVGRSKLTGMCGKRKYV